ncbi:MAG: hypothetical protein CBC13_11415 [Planctomycetia bacterium TMED53]|nr:MAG: hypothetical protein CBC13_11415 [Planctomycetia bacterium TMED53]
MANEVILELKDLIVRRGASRLGPLSLSLSRGSWISVIGANGSGKSSLLEAIAGFLPVESGSVVINGEGRNPTAEELAPWQRGIGWLGQQRGLWPHLTLRGQCGLHTESFSEKDLLDCAKDLNLESLLDRKPGQLSGGEAQRGELLRALSSGAPMLILDEPFAAQNKDHREAILERLEVEKSRGRAILMALHETLEGIEEVHLPTRESA